MIVTLQILGADIIGSDYSNSFDCAMTRAFRRAGYGVLETGGYIDRDFRIFGTTSYIMQTPVELHNKVLAMYAFANEEMYSCVGESNRYVEPIEPVDFTYEMEVPEEFAKYKI